MITEFLLFSFAFACLLLITLRENYYPSRKLPPGPLRLPFLGSLMYPLLNVTLPPVVMMKRLVDQYGSIAYLKLGPKPVVIIGELEAAKLALSNDLMEDRPYHEILAQRSWGQRLGIIFGNGDAWREMRRFSLRTLRDVSKYTNVNQTMEVGLHNLIERLDLVASEPVPILQVRRFFSWPVLQVMWSLLSFASTAEEEKILMAGIPLAQKFSDSFVQCGGILHVLPWLRHVAPKATGFAYFMDLFVTAQKHGKELLDFRRREYDPTESSRDWIDSFIANMEKREGGQDDDPGLQHYTERQFILTSMDLMFGGAETTNNSLEFAIYFVSRDIKVQNRIQEEIDRVVGRSRFPNMGDKPKMPYTEATLTEVNRMANTLPMIPRAAAEDVTLDGYFIKKGTPTFINLYGVHMSSKVWKSPYSFRPERFLNETGQLDPEMVNKVIAFGGGKRYCIAESWARATLFTYLTGLLQNFNFEFVNTVPPSTEIENDVSLNYARDPEAEIFTNRVKVGFTHYPHPFEVKLRRR